MAPPYQLNNLHNPRMNEAGMKHVDSPATQEHKTAMEKDSAGIIPSAARPPPAPLPQSPPSPPPLSPPPLSPPPLSEHPCDPPPDAE